jgi:hypothetical protein
MKPAAVAARVLTLALVTLAVAAPVLHAGVAGAATRRVHRVLIVSLPDVEWSDIERADVPNLHRLFARSAVGSLSTEGVLEPSPLGDNYLALGASAPATGDFTLTGQGFGVGEDFGDDVAGDVFSTRTGTAAPPEGIVYPPIAAVNAANAAEPYDAHIGLLGDALRAAGVERAVIANGDGGDPSTPERLYPRYRRAAVAALMTANGTLAAGRVDTGLLQADPDAPFGVRYDPVAVANAFDDAWNRGAAERRVVLFEGSDLVRADLEGRLSSPDARVKLRERALRDTDRIVGRMLDDVGPGDAVIVIAPEAPAPDIALTVAAVRAPAFGTGALTSSSTDRGGYVHITDIAPTVLDLLGVKVPKAMQGRVMESAGSRPSAATLVHASADAVFRDEQRPAAIGVLFGVGLALALATIGFVDRWPRARPALVLGALWILGYLAATFLATPFHFARQGGAFAYWGFVVGLATALAAAAWFVGRRRGEAVGALLAALGGLAALHLVDIVLGAHLELDSVFGYSATLDVRVGGVSGWAYAQLVGATLLFSGILAWRRPGRRMVHAVTGLLVVTLLVIALPFLGDDFAGAVVAAVAFGTLAWHLNGHRLRALATSLASAVFVVVAGAVGLVLSDARDATAAAARSVTTNLPLFDHSLLLGMVFVLIGLIGYLWYVSPRPLRDVVATVEPAPVVALALLVVAVGGLVLNAPNVSIAGMIAVVVEAAVVPLTASRR